MVLNLSENLQRQVNLLVRKLARKNELLEEKEKELAQKEARIGPLEGVVEAARAWCDAETVWQAHSGNCKKCSDGEMCSEEWVTKSFATGNAWANMFNILSKLEEV